MDSRLEVHSDGGEITVHGELDMDLSIELLAAIPSVTARP